MKKRLPAENNDSIRDKVNATENIRILEHIKQKNQIEQMMNETVGNVNGRPCDTITRKVIIENTTKDINENHNAGEDQKKPQDNEHDLQEIELHNMNESKRITTPHEKSMKINEIENQTHNNATEKVTLEEDVSPNSNHRNVDIDAAAYNLSPYTRPSRVAKETALMKIQKKQKPKYQRLKHIPAEPCKQLICQHIANQQQWPSEDKIT